MAGFLVDEQSWAIRYLIVNTSNWWVGHQVLVSPEWIGEVSWSYEKVTVSLDRQAIRDAPAYNADLSFARDEEMFTHTTGMVVTGRENKRPIG